MRVWLRIRSLLSRDLWKEPDRLVRARFRCDQCESVAATAWCVPRNTSCPALELNADERNRIVIDGFLGRLTEVIGKRPDKLWRVVEAADVRGLWALDPLWAPFFCSECQLSYCEAHWRTEAAFADDYPGWYEHTIGRCPRGHTRKLDD